MNDLNSALSLCDILVCGGGISGVTTALVLQSLGFRVGVLSETFPGRTECQSAPANNSTDPYVATPYAMASAYPHNLRVKDLLRISNDSQAVFSQLHSDSQSGVEIYRMFELFEHSPDAPPLASHRIGFEYLEGTPEKLKSEFEVPYRPGAEYIWGWKFDTYFADMPVYMEYL
ncbi:MAG: hypothetical protein K2Z81_05480, partial [Cyanobacteria bacterium]|nr:hypothetical protein [Cyanobacteriota bacterium]